MTIRTTRRTTKRPKGPKPTHRTVTITPQEDPINEESVDYDNNLQSFAVEPVIQHQEQSAFDSTFRTSASSSSLFFQPSAFVSPNSLNTGIVRPPPGFSSSSQPSSGTCHYICQLSGGCSVRIQTTGFINFVSKFHVNYSKKLEYFITYIFVLYKTHKLFRTVVLKFG